MSFDVVRAEARRRLAADEAFQSTRREFAQRNYAAAMHHQEWIERQEALVVLGVAWLCAVALLSLFMMLAVVLAPRDLQGGHWVRVNEKDAQ